MNGNRPIVLMILDGWGYRKERSNNAVALADTPFLDGAIRQYPGTFLTCSGEAVGLPEGVMGNSEVGHLNIGAGRVVNQDLVRINNDILSGDFFKNEAFNRVIKSVRDHRSALHLIGLVSDGGVHSHMDHLSALIDLARRKNVHHLYIHVILDGRDTAPDSGVRFVQALRRRLEKEKPGAIATVCGRYHAMDRDNRWDRIEKAFRLYTRGEGRPENDPESAVRKAYAMGETDEFVKPVVITDENGLPGGTMQDNDGVIFFNFRADRARELTRAFTDKKFAHFSRSPLPEFCGFVCMTQYDEKIVPPAAYPPIRLEGILGEVIGNNGLRQLRIAETEKYAHVTYFLNGGEETPFPGEDRCLIPSPREVPTYDKKPEMNAEAVTDELLQRIKASDYDLIVLNFANMDMVGHTGILHAAVRACETVDKCAKKITDAVLEQNGIVMITADHGNAETMTQEDGSPHTAHTLNPVRCVLINNTRKNIQLRTGGSLGDIAPTLLELMGLGKPEEMTGRSLLI